MFEEIVKRQDLTMIEKAEKSKEVFKEKYKDVDVYSLIELLITKQNKYEPNEKAEDLELIAIQELLEEKIKLLDIVETHKAITKIGIKRQFSLDEINKESKKLLDNDQFEKITKSLTEKGLNFSRLFTRCMENIATEDEEILASDINRKLKIKEKNKEIEILDQYKAKLKRNLNKNISK